MLTPEFLSLVAICAALTLGATEAFKRMFKWGGVGPIILSFFISGGVAGGQLVSGESFGVFPFIVLWLAGFLQANGFYLFVEEAAKKAGR